eukprot:Colp12_sorted_trinity150504_noHs@28170
MATARQTINTEGHVELCNSGEVQEVAEALEKLQGVCERNLLKFELRMAEDLDVIFSIIQHPVVSAGLLHWIGQAVTEKDYFTATNKGQASSHLVVLDEIARQHALLREGVFSLLVRLLESSNYDLDPLIVLEVKKQFVDQMVHLVSLGFVPRVLRYMATCTQDRSLIRHFIAETLDLAGPPFHPVFVTLMLGIVDPIREGFHTDERSSRLLASFVGMCLEGGVTQALDSSTLSTLESLQSFLASNPSTMM